MKQKIFKTIVVLGIIALLIGGDVLLLSQGIVQAMYEDLEAQETVTNSKNVIFDSYFKEGDERVHSKKSNISNGETLVVNIAVNDSRSIKSSYNKHRKQQF